MRRYQSEAQHSLIASVWAMARVAELAVYIHSESGKHIRPHDTRSRAMARGNADGEVPGPSGQGAGHPLRNRLKNTAVERAHNARLARQDAVGDKELLKRRKFHCWPLRRRFWLYSYASSAVRRPTEFGSTPVSCMKYSIHAVGCFGLFSILPSVVDEGQCILSSTS